jgi:phosphoglycerol transferase MdoB-like AlkP superfamily enzyme
MSKESVAVKRTKAADLPDAAQVITAKPASKNKTTKKNSAKVSVKPVANRKSSKSASSKPRLTEASRRPAGRVRGANHPWRRDDLTPSEGSGVKKKVNFGDGVSDELTRIDRLRSRQPMWLLPAIFYVVAFSYELVLKHFLNCWSFRSVLLVAIFSLVFAFIGFLVSFLPRIIARILSSIFFIGLAAVFIIQFALIQIRNLPASLAQMGMVKSEVGPVIETFWKELHTNWPLVASFAGVTAIAIFCVWFFNFSRPRVKNWWRTVLLTLGVTSALTGVILFTLQSFGEKFGSPHYLYFESNDLRAQVRELGLIAMETIDIRQTIIGFEPSVVAVVDPTKKQPKAPEYVPQTTFDLEAEAQDQPLKVAKLSSALAGTSPSYTNEYTGAFAGKNLVFVVAESFNSIAVDPNLTPNLHKMSNEGFVFENFYSPYILSTIGGEFQALTGLMPTQSLLKTWRDQTPNFPLAIGNSFGRVGYDSSSAYTLTENTFYERYKTRPTLGFSDFVACGQGMNALVGSAQCDRWIQSDVQLIDTIVPFITEKAKARDEDGNRIPFTSYLLTMSGHGEYDSWGFQWAAAQNRNAVNNLKMSTEAKIYQATQIELDHALGRLVDSLRSIGELDNTVIVLVGDHYPYMLSLNAVNELSDYERDAIIEVNRSNLIIWNSEMVDGRLEIGTREYAHKLGTTRIDKVGSQIDILPTLLNLWGIKFDSRLMMGRDILDDSISGLAIFADRSWVSDYGRYYAAKKRFVPRTASDGEPVAIPENYVALMNQFVASRFDLSESIVQNNYYSYLEFNE